MPRPRNPDRSFPRKPSDRRPLTSEAIASDLAAFEAAGGRVEVLGVTRTLKRIGMPAEDMPRAKDQPPR